MNSIDDSKLIAVVEPERHFAVSAGWYKEVKSANLNQICITEKTLVPPDCHFLNSANNEIGPVEGKTFVKNPFSDNVFIEVHDGLLKQLEQHRWEHYAETAHLLGAKSIKRISNGKNSDKAKTEAKGSAPACGLDTSYESSFLSEESIEINRSYNNAIPYDKNQYKKAVEYVNEHHLKNDPDFFSLLSSRNPENTLAVQWNYKYTFASTAQSTFELALNLDGLSDLLKITHPAGKLIPSEINLDRTREIVRSRKIDLEIVFYE